ncbi:Hsp20/alpha crystallin family protein [Staphylococcus saprophyticus]|jgi:HSP20 family protein|uniref:Putative small heat shock protein n=3 Tax=Staphylococcus saprophyticus TaxID=29385 RepID=A0A1L7RGU2_STASA|nr:Hsp20/alpha crystallin family protein [Staphylococcus saprophyticus]MBC2922032.1 Hsp20/alpha crystallin family protein [Staphylococcus saprophyticus]MBC2958613.1 Hsp20/alpha crystallin family protein [Staphylococcus saprophyticus]MBC3010490.1 Hsp20/alpha crystallin family protein [Staphylococcus saprophyticus]MBC3024369.1 Hsp20/alpha crystallin family protein [Staphylococcus saprophyticus]MBC3031617.1 Hsp20/alpha crystallin family protein [Staphylococcus saprophyticus]
MTYDLKPFGRDYFDMTPSELFRDFGRQFFSNFPDEQSIKTDISEKDDRYELKAELPGFSKDQIDISYENGMLIISAENNQVNEEKDDEGKVIQKERSYSNVKRMYSLNNIDEDNIEAKFEDGILSVDLPKTENSQRKVIDIN